MNLTILKDKIADFKKKSTNDFSKQVVREFESWFVHVENYLSEVELENFELIQAIHTREKTIELLIKLLIITGNSDKLSQLQVMDTEKAELVVNFLLHQNDRVNHTNLYSIATLLQCAMDDEKQIKDLKDLINYAGTGR